MFTPRVKLKKKKKKKKKDIKKVSRNLVPHLGKNNSNHIQGEEIKKFDQASVKVSKRSAKIT